MMHPTEEEWMAYLYGELGRKEQTVLKAHLRVCSECQTNLTVWRMAMEGLDAWKVSNRDIENRKIRSFIHRCGRWAVAAALLVTLGWIGGRLTAPHSPTTEQLLLALEPTLKASLEPKIRHNLREELSHDLQLAFAENWTHFEKQLHDDLNEYTVTILAASNTVTSHLLTELIQALNTTREEDRYWIATALDQFQLQQLKENALLRENLGVFAIATADELQYTNDLIGVLVYDSAGNLGEVTPQTTTDTDERKRK